MPKKKASKVRRPKKEVMVSVASLLNPDAGKYKVVECASGTDRYVAGPFEKQDDAYSQRDALNASALALGLSVSQARHAIRML